MKHLTLLHKGLILVSIPLCFEIGSFGYLLHLQNQVELEARKLNHLRQIHDELNLLMRDLVYFGRMSTALTFTTHLRDMTKLFREMHQIMAELSRLYGDDRRSQAVIARCDSALTMGESHMRDAAAAALNTTDDKELYQILHRYSRTFDNDLIELYQSGLLELVDKSSQDARNDHSSEKREQILVLLKCFLGLSVLFALSVTAWFFRNIISRVSLIEQNTERFVRGQALLPQLKGSDEIAALDRTLHRAASLIDQAMRKEKAILDNTKEVICSFDADFKIQSINAASMDLLQMESDELIRQSFLTLFFKDDRQAIEKKLAAARETQEPSQFESVMEKDGGQPIDVSVTVSYSRQDGVYYCSIFDLTAKMELERIRREVTAMITHDLKSPLQSVQNFLTMLAAGRFGPIDERGAKLMGLAERQTWRMADLIQSVLQLEQLRAGKMELESTRVNLKALVQECAEEVQSLAAEKSITFKFDLSEAPAMGEAKWIKQVFINILVNAIKYSPPDSVVRVKSRQAKDFSEVSIADNGPGLTEQEKIEIFERFHRLGRKEEQLVGSGLGLVICKELMTLHKGYINVESEPGKGSTFVLGFPLT